MSVRKLIGAAYHPGTSLKHSGEKIVPVDALHALALAPVAGATLIEARQGQDNIEQLKVVVKHVAMTIFAERGWDFNGRKMAPEERLNLFVNQVWREYMGEPCGTCKGHGYVGRKLDLVRHRLGKCKGCGGSGYQIIRLESAGEVREIVRGVCPVCRSKGLVEVVEELKAKRLRQCPACWGSGSVPAGPRARARAMRFDHQHIRRVWQERFRAVLMTLRELERDALIVCREMLYGPDG